jgi:hypothetical protein
MHNPIIVINAIMASKGHQVGRLLASCSNVLWYNHEGNGSDPWEPCNGILNAELSVFHYDRRFADSSTIPPVLDYARRSGLPETPELSYDRCEDGQYLLYVTHSDLDESREFFNGNHLVVLNKDIDRFFNTAWNFRVGKTKTLISELYTKEEAESMLANTFSNYETNITSDDFVIDSVDDLFDVENFKSLCEKFNLIFNEDRYSKVIEFLRK